MPFARFSSHENGAQPAATAQRLDGVRFEFRVASSAWLTRDRSANKEMTVEAQFSNIAEQAEVKEERGRLASEESKSDRKRALRELEFVGQRCSHHDLGVVTSTEKKAAALRTQHRPPTPNQTSQHNAIARLISVFESRSSRG